MILADKIMTLRKKAGWSQEELAAQLNVSRQSVSKWESAQSIPDMDKVVQMPRLDLLPVLEGQVAVLSRQSHLRPML